MKNIAFMVLCALAACSPDSPEESGGITRACVRSFAPTLDAWESELGRVPDECRYLDGDFDVQLVSAAEMPCDEPVGVNEVRTECYQAGALYLNKELDDAQLTDASVHGWVHALAGCVDGDVDHDHLRAGLWALYGAESVEIQAQASAEIGECL